MDRNVRIQSVYAREILDSTGLPTLEVTLWLENGLLSTASVPSGHAVGKHEAKSLRDQDGNRLFGEGVQKAVQIVHEVIGPKLIGLDVTSQTALDQLLVNLDGTPDKTNFGANTLLAISQAALKAGALSINVPVFYYLKEKYQLIQNFDMPTPIFDLINGGAHGASNLDLQEFQIIPASHFNLRQSMDIGIQLFHQLGEVLKAKGAIYSVGLSGGYAPNLFHNLDAFEILIETLHNTNYAFGRDVFFGVDAAADWFQTNRGYRLKDNPDPFSPQQLLEFYETLRKTYHTISIEDGFSQDATSDWQTLTRNLGETTMILADKMTSTNKILLQKAIQDKVCNGIIIKPHQIGTISETIETISLAKQAGLKIVVSHRSRETNDDFLADLSVGIGADYVKFGAPSRGERVVKYNRLMMIQAILDSWT